MCMACFCNLKDLRPCTVIYGLEEEEAAVIKKRGLLLMPVAVQDVEMPAEGEPTLHE